MHEFAVAPSILDAHIRIGNLLFKPAAQYCLTLGILVHILDHLIVISHIGFMTIYAVIIAFYFGTQTAKAESSKDGE